jgi:hypothetical protein
MDAKLQEFLKKFNRHHDYDIRLTIGTYIDKQTPGQLASNLFNTYLANFQTTVAKLNKLWNILSALSVEKDNDISVSIEDIKRKTKWQDNIFFTIENGDTKVFRRTFLDCYTTSNLQACVYKDDVSSEKELSPLKSKSSCDTITRFIMNFKDNQSFKINCFHEKCKIEIIFNALDYNEDLLGKMLKIINNK